MSPYATDSAESDLPKFASPQPLHPAITRPFSPSTYSWTSRSPTIVRSGSADQLLPKPTTTDSERGSSSHSADSLSKPTVEDSERSSASEPVDLEKGHDRQVLQAIRRQTIINSLLRNCYRFVFCTIWMLGSAAVGLLVSMLCMVIGRAALHRHEPFREVATGPMYTESSAGGALLGAGCGLLVWSIATLLDVWGDDDDDFTATYLTLSTIVTVLTTGFCGQAVGVVLLQSRVSGGLTVVHAFQANSVGMLLIIAASIVMAGAPYGYNNYYGSY